MGRADFATQQSASGYTSIRFGRDIKNVMLIEANDPPRSALANASAHLPETGFARGLSPAPRMTGHACTDAPWLGNGDAGATFPSPYPLIPVVTMLCTK